jgi:hypothetical protein
MHERDGYYVVDGESSGGGAAPMAMRLVDEERGTELLVAVRSEVFAGHLFSGV